jgi:hypothetical protein
MITPGLLIALALPAPAPAAVHAVVAAAGAAAAADAGAHPSAAASAAAAADAGAHASPAAALDICGGRPISRWSAGSGTYARTAEFGTADQTWMQAITGIVMDARGRLLVHDGVEGVVHVLTPELRRTAGFGRRGGGPGEFRPLTSMFLMGDDFLHQFIAADGASLFVHDGLITELTADGEYVARRIDLRRFGPGPIYGVRAMHATAGRLFFAVDALTSDQRQLETWEVLGSQAEIRHRLRLVTPPRVDGRFRTVGQEARPVWAASGPCVVLGDGASRWLLRLNLLTGESDTLRLPQHRVALRSRTDLPPPLLERWGGAAPNPAAIWAWREIRIDPDGHVWVNPWRPPTERAAAFYRIDPAGRLHEERLPAFPHAFGAPGVFYTRGRTGIGGEAVVARYERSR